MRAAALKEKIVVSILKRLSHATPQREEALSAVFTLTVPHLDEKAAQSLAGMVPQLPAGLYGRWASLFAERLVETVPVAQVEDLCLGTEESDAALALVYVMFMESERMEKVVAEDLKQLGVHASGVEDEATLATAWLKARMTEPYQ